MRWAGHVARMGEERGVYRVLVGKPEGRRPLGRPRRRWVDNIRMDLQEEGCGFMDWIGLAQDRDRWRTLVSAVMNLRVPWNAGNFLTSCRPVSFSRRTLHHGVSKYYDVITCCARLLPAPVIIYSLFITCGTRWGSQLRYCTTNQKVAGSISDDFIGIFYWRNPSGLTSVLWSTQSLNRNEYQE